MAEAIKRSESEIDDAVNQAQEGVDQGTKWPGMSYEEGVVAALMWVAGHTDEHPMAE